MNALNPLRGLAALFIAYLLGSVCFGILIARRKGVNLREHGSGNIGSTNVLRVIGKREALLTLIGDVLKGTAAVLIARLLTDQEVWLALSALAAILGHNYPIFFNWKGGKGVATTFGVLFAYMPIVGLILVLVWGAAVAWTHISSVGALTVSVLLPFLAYWLGSGSLQVLFSLTVGLMMLIRHKENIRRLVSGEEKTC